jgi:cyanophycinase-like exopeptidase
VLEALNRCTGYFFNGGNPELLSEGLLTAQGDSRALAVIRKRFEQASAVVAGTSAGSMIVGPITLCECGPKSSVNALTTGTLYQAPGYKFVNGVLVDGHFFTRGAHRLAGLGQSPRPDRSSWRGYLNPIACASWSPNSPPDPARRPKAMRKLMA